MSNVDLDKSKMLGFKILDASPSSPAETALKTGAKIEAKVGMKPIAPVQHGVKLGSKVGAKVGGKMV